MTEKERILRAAKKGKSAEEIAEEADFNDDGKPRKKRPDREVTVEPGDNARFINHAMRLASLPRVDMDDAEEIAERCNTYFRMATEDNAKPSLAALSLALGVDRNTVYKVVNGMLPKKSEVVNALKRAVQLIDMLMVDYMQNGKINPVSGIFIMKNTLGYKDQQEFVVAPAQPLGEGRDPDELRRRYLESVVPSPLPDAESPFDVIEVEYADVPEEGAES